MKLPAATDVPAAKPFAQKVAYAKARLAKVRATLAKGGTVEKSNPKHRAARKRVKRAQRRLRETLRYAAARQPPAPPASGEAAPSPPAS